MKAGANQAACGENAIIQTACTADLIIGAISVEWANTMRGELTPKMAEAIMSSPAQKILGPLTQEPVVLVGVASEPLPHLVQRAVSEKIEEVLDDM